MASPKKTAPKTTKLLGTLICIFQKSEVEITFDGSAFEIKALECSLTIKKWQMLQILEKKKDWNVQFDLKGKDAEISVILKRTVLKKQITEFLVAEKLLEEVSKSPKQRLIRVMKSFTQK